MAVAAGVLAANAPDVDAVTMFVSRDLSLGFRRGWTHGVLAMALLPLVLTAALLVLDRTVARWRGREPAARAGPLLRLTAAGVWSHPLLDWLNTYGVRFLMPFDGTWAARGESAAGRTENAPAGRRRAGLRGILEGRRRRGGPRASSSVASLAHRGAPGCSSAAGSARARRLGCGVFVPGGRATGGRPQPGSMGRERRWTRRRCLAARGLHVVLPAGTLLQPAPAGRDGRRWTRPFWR